VLRDSLDANKTRLNPVAPASVGTLAFQAIVSFGKNGNRSPIIDLRLTEHGWPSFPHARSIRDRRAPSSLWVTVSFCVGPQWRQVHRSTAGEKSFAEDCRFLYEDQVQIIMGRLDFDGSGRKLSIVPLPSLRDMRSIASPAASRIFSL